jgi:HEPN domain-containing protein
MPYTRDVIPTSDLRDIAQARLDDARALHQAGRFDGSVYLCGYAVEIALKARICDCLRWPGYPDTNAEFRGYTSFRTHDLEVLLHLSGAEAAIREGLLLEWSIVLKWDPDARYRAIGRASSHVASAMLTAVHTLLGAL